MDTEEKFMVLTSNSSGDVHLGTITCNCNVWHIPEHGGCSNRYHLRLFLIYFYVMVTKALEEQAKCVFGLLHHLRQFLFLTANKNMHIVGILNKCNAFVLLTYSPRSFAVAVLPLRQIRQCLTLQSTRFTSCFTILALNTAFC